MINGIAVQKIKRELNLLLKQTTLEYMHIKTGLSIEGIRKAASVTTQYRPATAQKLAKFIEEKTCGNVRATDLLSPTQTYKGADLRDTKHLSGQDLSYADFMRADLSGADLSNAIIEGAQFDLATMQGVNLQGVKGQASFRCANLNEANFENLIVDWDLTGASAQNARIKDATFKENTRLTGVDFSGSSANWQNVIWHPNGSQTLGATLPKIAPWELKEAFCDHLVLLRGFESIFEIDLIKAKGDPDILQICEFITSRDGSSVQTYDTLAKQLLLAHEDRIDDLINAFGQFEWYARERLEFALYIQQHCRTLGDYEALRNTEFYINDLIPSNTEQGGAKKIVEKYIQQAKQGDFAHLPQ